MQGVWGDMQDTPWEFYLADVFPTNIPVSTVMGLPFFEDKIALVLTHRGWEIPGGHLEAGEEVIDCLHRELLEEIGAENIRSEKLFGYRKIVNPDRKVFATEGKKYPRETLVPYYLVELTQPPGRPRMPDAYDARLFNFDDSEVMESHDKDVISSGLKARQEVRA